MRERDGMVVDEVGKVEGYRCWLTRICEVLTLTPSG